MAFSWDGRSLALLRGLAFMPDDARLLYGLVEHQSRVLLFDGLGSY